MSEWDTGRQYQSKQREPAVSSSPTSPSAAHARFLDFLNSYREGSWYLYRELLKQRFRTGKYYLDVDLEHLSNFGGLHDLLLDSPAMYLPIFERAVQEAVKKFSIVVAKVDEDGKEEAVEVPKFQVHLKGDLGATHIRSITASSVNRLIRVPGIIISCTKSKAKPINLCIRCKNCGNIKHIPCLTSFGSTMLPRTCDGLTGTNPDNGQNVGGAEKCPLDPFIIVPDKCTYVDQQTLKLQEAPEDVNTGDMPRHTQLALDRYLVDRVAPGARVSVMGIVSVFNSRKSSSAAAVRTPYLKVVGITAEADTNRGRAATFTDAERADFKRLAQEENMFKVISDSVAPSIWGSYTEDIKKAIACLLVGGSRKLLPDGMRLRGDINVLLLGDPSTAKSQFLKFAEKVAPVGVYTSGKGSSAAGLTASVIRDAKGEFYLEGGAMVLADGGVVCIDEFDKMRPEDRVAIHEAMEQQTISVAKAGITTILNSRTSVLAAANPVYGRYDDLKTAADNIDFLPTILSRFDLIFIVRDVRDRKRDMEIAKHVLGVHVRASGGLDSAQAPSKVAHELELTQMKRFIQYVRDTSAPCLNKHAHEALKAAFVDMRKKAREHRGAVSKATIPITIRQLEALVRISESIAKFRLSKEVTVADVEEAVRLFNVSTLNAAASGYNEVLSGAAKEDIKRAENMIKSSLKIGTTTQVNRLRGIILKSKVSDSNFRQAINIMRGRGELSIHNEGHVIHRVK